MERKRTVRVDQLRKDRSLVEGCCVEWREGNESLERLGK